MNESYVFTFLIFHRGKMSNGNADEIENPRRIHIQEKVYIYNYSWASFFNAQESMLHLKFCMSKRLTLIN